MKRHFKGLLALLLSAVLALSLIGIAEVEQEVVSQTEEKVIVETREVATEEKSEAEPTDDNADVETEESVVEPSEEPTEDAVPEFTEGEIEEELVAELDVVEESADLALEEDIAVTAESECPKNEDGHLFNNGVCMWCGYPCPHDIVETLYEEELRKDSKAVPYDQFTHVEFYDIYSWTSCAICQKNLTQRIKVQENVGSQRGGEYLFGQHTNLEYDYESGEYSYTSDICTKCGFSAASSSVVCEHKRTETYYRPDEGCSYTFIDNQTHKVTGTIEVEVYCNDCYKTISTSTVNEIVEGHSCYNNNDDEGYYQEGFCFECQNAIECSHTNVDYFYMRGGDLSLVYYVNTNDSEYHETHMANGYGVYECADCGLSWMADDNNDHIENEAHIFSNGSDICALCGYVKPECTHANKTYDPDDVQTSISEIPGDDAMHTVTTVTTRNWTCDDCEETGSDAPETKEEKAAHDYTDGKCNDCDHVCGHANLNLGEAVINVTYADDGDDSEHSMTKEIVTPWTCQDCGESGENRDAVKEDQAHNYVDGICEDCEHECGHTDEKIVDVETSFDRFEDMTDAGHTEVFNETTTETCPDCGTVTNTTRQEVRSTEAHQYENGVCADCDYACGHSDTEISSEYRVEFYVSNGSSGHTATGDVYSVESCVYCGERISEDLIESDVQQEQKHRMSGGKCALCGYIEPASEKAEENTVTEPVFSELSAAETLHGMTTADNIRMGVALARAAQDFVGLEQNVEVRFAEEILTAQEHSALRALNPVEQVLVVLAALGYDEEVEVALADQKFILSDEALALIDAISARALSMTEEQLAERQAQIEKYFLIVASDSVEITLDAGTHLERYRFQEQDGVWLLTDLAIAPIVN